MLSLLEVRGRGARGCDSSTYFVAYLLIPYADEWSFATGHRQDTNKFEDQVEPPYQGVRPECYTKQYSRRG